MAMPAILAHAATARATASNHVAVNLTTNKDVHFYRNDADVQH
jgi:hypothetical protein